MTIRQQLSLTILILAAPHLSLMFVCVATIILAVILLATMGFDFMEKKWCPKHDICWNPKVNLTCPLCRAEAVLQERDTKIAELVKKS